MIQRWFEQRQQGPHLGKLSIVLAKGSNRILVHLGDLLSLFFLGHPVEGVLFAILPRMLKIMTGFESRSIMSLTMRKRPEDYCARHACSLVPESTSRPWLTQYSIEASPWPLKVGFAKIGTIVYHHMQVVARLRENVISERNRPVICVYDMTWLLMNVGNSIGKLRDIGNELWRSKR